MGGVVEPSPDASVAAAAQIGRERDKGERTEIAVLCFFS